MDDRDECYIALYTAKTAPFMVPKTLLTELVGALPLFRNESNVEDKAFHSVGDKLRMKA